MPTGKDLIGIAALLAGRQQVSNDTMDRYVLSVDVSKFYSTLSISRCDYPEVEHCVSCTCRDCCHYNSHPSRCNRTRKSVSPLQLCCGKFGDKYSEKKRK